MTTEQYIILGKFIEAMTPHGRALAGRAINAAVLFLQSGVELSRKGRKGFLKTHPEFTYGSNLEALNDFLYFAGVRTGRVRKAKIRPLMEKAELSNRNKEKVAAFLTWLEDKRDYSQATLQMHRHGMSKFFSYADEFNQDLARRFIATLEEKGLSPKTVNMRIISLRLFGDFVKKPVDIKTRKVARTLCTENVPTEKEYQRLLNWAKQNDYSRAYWLIRLLGSTGMRSSEMVQMRWSDVLNGEAYIKCKGAKYRSIYFTKAVVEEAKEYITTKNIDTNRYVCVNRNGEQCGNRTFGWWLRRTADKSGVPKEKVHCHAFRHFFAKMYLKKANDVMQLADFLGHGSVNITRIYLQKSKAEQVRDINRHVIW